MEPGLSKAAIMAWPRGTPRFSMVPESTGHTNSTTKYQPSHIFVPHPPPSLLQNPLGFQLTDIWETEGLGWAPVACGSQQLTVKSLPPEHLLEW